MAQVVKPRGKFGGAIKFGDDVTDIHQITGSLYISGTIHANEYKVDAVTTTITNIEQQGSTKFGDSTDDTHEFTGSFYVKGATKINGNLAPSADEAKDLGATDARWANVYAQNIHTGDLHLTNERGSWSIIEEKEYLSIRNNSTGQFYKIMMIPVADPKN